MWGYIIAINPKRVKNKLLKALSLLDFYFMFKNTYTDIEVKKNVSIITKTTNKITLKIPSLLPYYQNLNCMKKKYL